MRSLTVRPSELKLFRRCRRQWEIEYVHGLHQEDSEEGVAHLGTLVHKMLEGYYKTPDKYAKEQTFEGVDWSSPDATLASIMVEGYLDWIEETGADDGLKVEAVEKELEVTWPDWLAGRDEEYSVTLQGHIDLLATDHLGRLLLIDHKTVQSLEQYSRQLQVDSQMLTYALMLKLRGTDIDGAIHNALRRVKRSATANPPFYQRNVVNYNVQQLRNHYEQIGAQLQEMIRVREGIEQGDRALSYPNPTRDCTWACKHLSLCPAFDDGSNINLILSNMKEAAHANS